MNKRVVDAPMGDKRLVVVLARDGRYHVSIYTHDDRLRNHFWLDVLDELSSRVAEALSTPDLVTEAWEQGLN